MSPSSSSNFNTAPTGTPFTQTSAVFQASYTNGAPGSPSYNWVWNTQDAASFVNPLGASSQRIRRTSPATNAVHTSTFHCDVTDSQGHTSSSPVCTATFEVDNLL